MADSQRSDSVSSDVCPAYWEFYSNSVTWPSSMIIIPGTMIDQYGDLSVIERHYPQMVKWMEQMAGEITGNIMTRDVYGNWCFPPDDLHTPYGAFHGKGTSGPLIATTYFYRCATLMSRYATLLHKPAHAVEFDAIAQKMKTGLEGFYKQETRQYDNGSATSAVLPLAFGMVPDDQRHRVVAQLAATITRENHEHISCGLIGCQWINTTLARNCEATLA